METVYKTKIKHKGKFDLKSLYEFLHNLLKDNDWKGLSGEDYYEVYYYHRVAPDNSVFVEILWKATQNFWEDELKIDWYLTLKMKVDDWNPQTQQGTVEIELEAEHDVQEPSEPSVQTPGEKMLSKVFKINPKWLKKTWSKVRSKDPSKASGKKLYIHSDNLKKEIIKFLQGFYP